MAWRVGEMELKKNGQVPEVAGDQAERRLRVEREVMISLGCEPFLLYLVSALYTPHHACIYVASERRGAEMGLGENAPRRKAAGRLTSSWAAPNEVCVTGWLGCA
jgi:hypothetical protein